VIVLASASPARRSMATSRRAKPRWLRSHRSGGGNETAQPGSLKKAPDSAGAKGDPMRVLSSSQLNGASLSHKYGTRQEVLDGRLAGFRSKCAPLTRPGPRS
jgi:hypothetical protein